MKLLPLNQHVFIAGLQLHHGLSAAGLKVFVGIEALLCLTVEIFQIREGI